MPSPRPSLLPVVLAALLLGACAAGTDFHRPGPPAGAAYAPTPLPAAVGADAADAQRFAAGADVPFEWWRGFGDPALAALVERALVANPSLRSAEAALRAARELVRAQQGYFLPNVAANYDFERQKLAGNLSGTSAPGVQGNGASILATQNPNSLPHNEPLYYNFHTAQVNVGFVPDLFGGNRRKVESLEAAAEAQRFQLEATYVTLATNVVAAAVLEASTRAALASAVAIVDCNRQALAILRDKVERGFATRADLAGAEAALAAAEEQLPPLERQLEQTRDLIRALVGNLPGEDVAATFEMRSLALPRELPLSVPARIIEQRPDVRAAEEAVRAANANAGAALAAMLPEVSITGAVGGTATTFPYLFRSGGPFWNLIGGLTQPLFAGGTLLHTRRAADAALVEAAADYQTAVLTAYQNVADTLHALVADTAAVEAARAGERAARAGADSTHARREQGYVDALADLAAEVAYQQALAARVAAEAQRYTDTAALYLALGGGWWHRVPAAPEAAARAAATP
jgi:NodT family efflux transporter outer membrane factor (OMF) lipoprotein